jgi:hypothetical protein
MGFFALLDSPEAGTYEVIACHVNVWSLNGLFGHRPMVFDVGVRLKAQSEVGAIKLAVPIDFGAISDLSEMLSNTDEASLIFGKDFRGGSHEHLELGLPPQRLAILPVDAAHSGIDEAAGESGLSVVIVRLTRTLAANQEGYARVRLVADGAGEMWRWRWVMGRRNGALIDFRSPDPREGAGHRSDLSEHAIKLRNLNVFFMLPDRFQLRVAEPSLAYIRTLEGRQWRRYLRRRPTRVGRQRIMVYRWKVEEASFQDVFRGVMQFTREPGFRPPSDYLLSALVLAILLFALFRPLALRHGIDSAGTAFADWVSSGVGLVVAIFGGAGAVFLAVASRIGKLRQTIRNGKRWWKKNVEYKLYS